VGIPRVKLPVHKAVISERFPFKRYIQDLNLKERRECRTKQKAKFKVKKRMKKQWEETRSKREKNQLSME
jgi:hypothetical protein